MQFLLLQGDKDIYWSAFLANVIAPLGSLNVANADEWTAIGQEEPDGLIIVDTTHIERFEQLVARIYAENPSRRIVVMTASPTWKRARAAFESGAIDYLPKTLPADELRATFEELLRRTSSQP
jgi:DNA-binding NtrC family response regulator